MIRKYLKLNIYTRISGFLIDLVFLLVATINQQQIFYTQTWVLLILGSVFGTFLNASLISGNVNVIIFSIVYLVFSLVSFITFTDQIYFLYFILSSFVMFSLNKKVITNDQIIRNSLIQSIQNTVLLFVTLLLMIKVISFSNFLIILSTVLFVRCIAFYFICIDCRRNEDLTTLSVSSSVHVLTIFRPVIINSLRFFVPESQMGLVAVLGKILNSLYIFLVTPLILRQKFHFLFMFWVIMIILAALALIFLQVTINIMLLFIIFMLAEIIYIQIHKK